MNEPKNICIHKNVDVVNGAVEKKQLKRYRRSSKHESWNIKRAYPLR